MPGHCSNRMLIPIIVGVMLCATTGCTSILRSNGALEEFFPPTAEVVDRADCSLPDIRGPLEQLTDPYLAVSSAVQRGYPAAEFEPVAVFRCERGETDTGGLTIDTVHLDGDVAAVADAFRTPSKQFADPGTTVSCAIIEIAPAGLWLVDATGRAILPQWPIRPCGFLPEPSGPLSALHEVNRASAPVPAVSAGEPGRCEASLGSSFATTSEEDVAQDVDRDREREGYRPLDSELATPTDEVGRLQVCRFGTPIVESSAVRLTLSDSKRLLRAATESSVAPACAEVASRFATVDLRRPDGSGGTRITAELDGCRRIDFGGYRSIPAEVTELLTAPA